MNSWNEFYQRNQNNSNENFQSLWLKYNDHIYYDIPSGSRKKIQNDTVNDYIADDYVEDYLE